MAMPKLFPLPVTHSKAEPCPLHVTFPSPRLGTVWVRISSILMFEETLPRLQVQTHFRANFIIAHGACTAGRCMDSCEPRPPSKPRLFWPE